jgi:hypothetical protein
MYTQNQILNERLEQSIEALIILEEKLQEQVN